MTTDTPNILLVMVDQLVPMLTGAYGHPVVKTPNLDRLAAQSVRFDSAYTPCPVCSPARASFMSGMYVSNIGCYDNATVLPADQPTFAHYLTNAGYETILSGKMHFVGPDQLHGFRRRLTTDIYPSRFNWVPSRDEDGNFLRGGHVRNYIAPNVGVRSSWNKGFAHDEETHFRALEYLHGEGLDEPGAEGHQPFFFCVSYHHPHEPFHVPQELWDLYADEPIDIPEHPENLDETYSEMDRWLNEAHGTDHPLMADPDSLTRLRRSYYGLVTYIDRKVGELLAALEGNGLADNTIVIFTSDHGDMLGEKRMVQKRCFYEWSARIPLLIRFPDGRNAGQRVEQPASLMDLAPTLLEMAGTSAAPDLPMDGQSLLPLLEADSSEERVVFSEFHTDKVKEPCFMAREGRYKYIHIYGHPGQLFDLQEDPDEWHNLLGQPQVAEVEERLRGLVLEQFDPAAIKADAARSIRQREVIKQAMQRNDTHWDYFPPFDATRQYTR